MLQLFKGRAAKKLLHESIYNLGCTVRTHSAVNVEPQKPHCRNNRRKQEIQERGALQ